MLKKILAVFMSAFMILLAVPVAAFAADEETLPVINLTVGNELVGEDSTKWTQTGTELKYTGTGYTYYTTTDKVGNGRLVLDGTTLDSYYTFEYSGTEAGKQTYEAPGVITLNFVRLDGDVSLQSLEELVVVVEEPTQLTIKNHKEDSRTGFGSESSGRCFGVYSYKEYGEDLIPVISITGEKLSISGGETIIGEFAAGIFVQELEIGNDEESGAVSITGINAECRNYEDNWTIRINGIETTEELYLGKDSSVEIADLTASSDKYATVDGINAAGAYIDEGATIDIGNLTASAHEGPLDYDMHVVGISMYDDLENHGTINIGQDDTKIVMNFSNDYDGEIVSFAAGAEGIRCPGCELLNFGTINVDNIVTNFSTNALGDYDIRMEAYADGIYSQLPISNFSGAVMRCNMADGMELNVKAPNNDNGSYFSYGILAANTGCYLLAEDAIVEGRAGRMHIPATDGSGASAMGIFSVIIDATDSLVKGMANISNVTTSGEETDQVALGGFYTHKGVMANEVRNNQLAIVCDELEAKGSTYIFADSRGSEAISRGDGIEIMGAWSLGGTAVIEAYGANNNAITTTGETILPTLEEDYGPKLEYGPDEKNVTTIYALEGEEYAENAYAKISNEKITSALMEHVDAKVGDTTFGIVVSGIEEGERFFISIEKDGEAIGTTETITSDGTVTAYLYDGNKLEKEVIYTAKLYKFRDKEASKSDLVGILEFDAEEIPVTGDSNHTALFVLLIAAAAVAMFLGGRKLVRR